MSVTAKGTRWQVRYRVEGVHRARTFESPADARAFDKAVQAHVALERAQRAWESIPPAQRRAVRASA